MISRVYRCDYDTTRTNWRDALRITHDQLTRRQCVNWLALPSAFRPCLGGRRRRAGPAAEATTTLETLRTEGHRARASAAASDDYRGTGAHLVHTHTLCRRAVRFYCYIMRAAPAPARRTRLVPRRSTFVRLRGRKEATTATGFFPSKYIAVAYVRPTTVAAPQHITHADECDARTRLLIREKAYTCVKLATTPSPFFFNFANNLQIIKNLVFKIYKSLPSPILNK